MRVKVNFGDIEDFSAVPEGVYTAVIEKIEYKEPKDAGKAPYLNVEYTISDGEHTGRKVWEVLSWAPKAMFRMRDFFRAFGYEEDDYEVDVDEASHLLLEPDLQGEAVEITVENEIYNKKEVNRVVAIEPLNGPVAQDDEEDEASEDEEDAPEDEEDAPEEEEVEVKKAKAAPKAEPKRTFRPTSTGAKKAAPARRTFR